MEIKIELIKKTLDAMFFNIAPYADENKICEHEFIKELAEAYNELVEEFSKEWVHYYPTFKIE